MKKQIIKIISCCIVFLVTAMISSRLYNQGNADMTAQMAGASLPLVHMTWDGETFNTLHGLRQEADGCLMRDTITPLGTGRALSFSMDTYGCDIEGLSFEVRSIDGTRLVEKTDITDYQQRGDTITANVIIKDLIEQDTEYNWILLVETGQETIRYYTRIIAVEDYHVAEKLAFVREFHEKTFDSERLNDLSTFMESNSKGDNTTLAVVDIHSSLSQVGWGGLNVTQISENGITISEIDASTASLRMSYMVSVREDGDENYYHITEFYRIRYTEDRTYLLDFERTMNQLFDAQADVYASNKIMLGIRDSEVEMKESDGGENLAFVNDGQLFCYHASDAKLACLFSFYDKQDGEYDERSIYDHHGIKILNVDETGNVTFLVYGYMNRGTHEGTIGLLIYEYNGMLNTIEERVFIPSDKTYAVLAADIEQLAYVNKSEVFYLYLDGTILAADLTEGTYEIIAEQVQQGSFQVSDNDEMLVWQDSDTYDSTQLIWMNLNTDGTQEIHATGDSRILALGFINEDLIYGVARYADIVRDSTGTVTFPMYAVYIRDERGEILKRYAQDGVYVTGSSVESNLITLQRVVKDEQGGYEETTDDQIVNNVIEDDGYNSSETVATQNYETIVQLVLKSTIETKSLKFTDPKEVLYEGSRELVIDTGEPVERYYVYGKDGIMGIYSRPADAVNLAYDVSGTVIDENGDYIWKKTSRSTRNQIMAITAASVGEDGSSLAVCLDTILTYEGSLASAQELLNSGKTAADILEAGLEDARVLELGGTSLDAALYYVNLDIPVLATFEDDSAVLIVGFNEQNVVIMEPASGTLYKKGINDATEWFAEDGNQFITYSK